MSSATAAVVTAAQPGVEASNITSSSAVGVSADCEGELFDTYTEEGAPLGRQLRSVCHAQGVWHKAVYCFVFDSEGRLLIQRRSLKKKIGPGQWDLSVAEHLSPGESFLDGVARGLQEELGLSADKSVLHGPLAPLHKRKLDIPKKGVKDYEFVESYRLDGYSGSVHFNSEEVMEVRWAPLQEVVALMASSPEDFTLWFREELASLGYFGHTLPQ